jgi:transcriptional regulator of arginine metabolism
MTKKHERQTTIRELVESRPVSSQEELRKLLRHRGWDVGQSTLSRDLREMRLVRVPAPQGARYAFTETSGDIDDGRAPLNVILPPLFVRVEGVGELVVLRTIPGGAQPVGVALDAEQRQEILGTIAGDDTILIVCRSGAARDRLIRYLRAMATQEPATGRRDRRDDRPPRG